MRMHELDDIFKGIAQVPHIWPTLIACFSKGASLPQACAPMLRDPEPPKGQPIRDLEHILEDVLARNNAIHDGAIMFVRGGRSLTYVVSGWSYRLFPSRRWRR